MATMDTDTLIENLARDASGARKVISGAFIAPVLAALGLSIGLLTLFLGAPIAWPSGGAVLSYAVKLSFGLSVAVLGSICLYSSGKPGHSLRARMMGLSLPFAAILCLAGLDAAQGGSDWLGQTWLRCLVAISSLGSLAFLCVLRSLRSLAPTRLSLTGALAGVAGGGIAASAYGLWCPEQAPLFLLSWYAIPILMLGLIGALVGPRLLRW